MANIKTIINPEEFQGRGKRKAYFEGWYFKVVDESEAHAYAFIPGIAMDETGKRQAFIQVLDGKKNISAYHKFDSDSFTADRGVFKIAIAGNHFSRDSITLDLPGIKGSVQFKNHVSWPKHWYSPGIMGPFAFVPFMECSHGLVSLDHSVNGRLEINGESVHFNDGRGYIEKDWGRSFPSAYVWMQSNHFGKPGISMMCSVAKIPWLGFSFTGFIAGIWILGRLIKFTTYNNSSLRTLRIASDGIDLILENKNHVMEIQVKRNSTASLASPLRGLMDGRTEESMSSILKMNLTDAKTGQSILKDSGRNAGLEVAGDVARILRQ